MIVIKLFLLFLAIVSMILLIEQLYLVTIAVNIVSKTKCSFKDDGRARLFLTIVFSICASVLVVFWDKF